MADSASGWAGSPDPIKIGWLGSALDGPDGGYNKIHRMAFDEALEQGLLDRPVEFVLHAENGLPVARLATRRMGSSTSSTKAVSASPVRTARTTRSSPPRSPTSSRYP